MTAGEILTLTAYFAERERTDGRFLAEAMLDLFGDHRVASSVMLRGIASFGPANVVRSDRSLSLSEDPPVTITAVDTADRILGLTDAVTAMTGRGVITLERGRQAPVETAAFTDEGSVRLTLHVGRRHRVGGRPGFLAVSEVLHRLGFVAAEVFLGVDGTVAGQRRRARFFNRNADVPLLISGVGTPAQAANAAAELAAILPGALVTTERIQVCKNAGQLLAEPRNAPVGQYLKLTVRTAEDSRHDGRPIHRELIRRLKAGDHANGATALRGIWGFRDNQRPHGDRLFQLARRVPVNTVMVDTPPSIMASFAIVDELTSGQGLVTCEVVPAMMALQHTQRRGTLRLG